MLAWARRGRGIGPVRAPTWAVIALVLLVGVPLSGPWTSPVQGASNPIVTENQQPGSGQWQIPNASGTALADDTNNQIKGYASAASLNKGSSITFYVTVNPAQTFTMDIFRVGYYQGLGGRLMQHVNALQGVRQPACPIVDASTRLVVCSWSPSYTLTVPTTWTDGLYLVVLTNAKGYQNDIVLTVRDDARTAALLFQQSVNTYQAYNDWGGYSL